MCGIVGFCGAGKNGNVVVLDGLKSLEYRGYDSWGIVARDANGLHSTKDTGKIGHVQNESLGLPHSTMSLGHTRWATHGGVTKSNAHPHFSQDGSIAVVHNGIVENFFSMREYLKEQGITFSTDTDTEVLPHHIQHLMERGMDFASAVRETLKHVEGSFAIVAVHKDSNVMIGARRGSPLVLGIGTNEYYLASDVPAFLAHTRDVVYLDDDELVLLSDSYTVEGLHDGIPKQKKVHTIEWSVEQAQKGNYDHFMLKEINEQRHTIQKALEQDPGNFASCVEALQKARGIFFVGCGTSYHACVSASYVFSHVAKQHVNVVLASEFRNYEEFLTNETLMVAVSQSGETADLLDAVKTAKRKGVKILCIVNVMGSTLMRMADYTLLMNAGPEICVLSTKSYTSQLALLLQLCYSVAGKADEGRALVEKVSSAVPSIIDVNHDALKQLATRIKDQRDFFLIGRDLAYPSALEGALKVKEVSYIHAEGFAGGELKHGTIALIEEGVPVVVLSTDATRSLILSNAMEIKARGGFLIGIDSQPSELFDVYINIDEFGSADPIAMIIPIQILSYYLALERGCDPDKPRNLAKSVTVK